MLTVKTARAIQRTGDASPPPASAPQASTGTAVPPALRARDPPPGLAGASAGAVFPLTSSRGHFPYATFSPETRWPTPVLQLRSSYFSMEGMFPEHSYAPLNPAPYDYGTLGHAYSHGAMPHAAHAPSHHLYMGGGHTHAYYSSSFSHQYLAQVDADIDAGAGMNWRHGNISLAVNPGKPYFKANKRQKEPKEAMLFVFYVPNAMTNELLYHLFEPFGTILRLSIAVHSSTGRGKGYAYVNYASVASAEDAINHLHGKMVLDKRLKVEHRKKKTNEKREPRARRDRSLALPRQRRAPARERAGRPGARPPLLWYHSASAAQLNFGATTAAERHGTAHGALATPPTIAPLDDMDDMRKSLQDIE